MTIVSPKTYNFTATTLTTEASAISNTENLDATIEEQDVLNPAQIDTNSDNAPDPENKDQTHLPNNNFCFIERQLY